MTVGATVVSFISALFFCWFFIFSIGPDLGSDMLLLALIGTCVFCFYAMKLLVRLLKIRNSKLAARLTVTGALMGLLCFWLLMKYLFDLNQSLAAVAAFLLELFAIVLFAACGAARQASRPFSELGQEWLDDIRLNMVAILPANHNDAIEALANGDLSVLRNLAAKPKAEKNSSFKIEPHLVLRLLMGSTAEGACLTMTLYDDQKEFTLNTLELDDEEFTWILDKYS